MGGTSDETSAVASLAFVGISPPFRGRHRTQRPALMVAGFPNGRGEASSDAMSEVESAVRRFFPDVWNNGDVSAAGNFAEFVSHNTLDVLGPTEYGQAVLEYRGAFPDLITTLEDVFAAGERVAVRGTDHGTHRSDFMGRPATGRQVTSTWIEIFRLQDGKAVGGWLETDLQRLLNQLS